MAERNLTKLGMGVKPVPMKLFSTWEVETASHNCVPRLCSLTLNRLVVLRTLESELTSVIIATKMQNSKRVLRSYEIPVPSSGLVDTELELSFSLQYPHYLKRDGNKLHILLQRRKKYKNRTILGYKTLAIGQVSMSQVLQRAFDKELHLYSELKERSQPLALVRVVSLSSQPVDQFDTHKHMNQSSDVERSPDMDNDSDDDDSSSNEEMSDTENINIHKSGRRSLRPMMLRQKNFKQKFTALLKKFKLSEEVLDSEPDQEMVDVDQVNNQDIDDLIDELENLSDSDPDVDQLSIVSTPRPSLRPFFTPRRHTESGSFDSFKESAKTIDEAGRRSDSDSHAENVLPSTNVHIALNNMEPRKALLEQLKSVLGDQEDRLPEIVIFVNTSEWQGQFLVQKLQDKQVQLVCTCGMADIKACINSIVTRLQKFCNSNPQTPKPIKVGMAGGDAYFNSVLRFYVDYFSKRSPEWLNFIKFLVIPTGPSTISKYLSSIDPSYSTLFNDSSWKDTFDKLDSNKLDASELYNRISTYINSAHGLTPIPIAQAMVTYKSKTAEEDTSQIFLPFMSEVKIGNPEAFNTSVELDENVNTQIPPSSSPPHVTPVERIKDSQHTPPNSPCVGTANSLFNEFVELLVEFWTTMSTKLDPNEKDKDKEKEKDKERSRKESNKCSIKTAFRYLHVGHLPPAGDGSMAMTILTREKKQKIMRIGKKSKDVESKREVIEGISRLICSSKSQHNRLKVTIDGQDWHDVKFFQLSPLWQTHVKHFPVIIFGNIDTPC